MLVAFLLIGPTVLAESCLTTVLNNPLQSFRDLVYENVASSIDETGESDFVFYVKTPFPSVAKSSTDGRLQYQWNGRNGMLYVGMADQQRPFVGINKYHYTGHFDYSLFYDSVYQNYAGTIDDDISKVLHQIDVELFEQETRTAALVVQSELPRENGKPEVYGTLRIFDAGSRPWGLQFAESNEPLLESFGPSSLPFQRMNVARGIAPIRSERYLAEQMALGRKVIEIGKFSLRGTSEQKSRARNLLEAYLYFHVARLYPDAIILTHVASSAHARLYSSVYGFKPAEVFNGNGDDFGEMILWATGREMQRRLLEHPGLKSLAGSADDSVSLYPELPSFMSP